MLFLLQFLSFTWMISSKIWFCSSLVSKSSMIVEKKMTVMSLKGKFHNRRHNIDIKNGCSFQNNLRIVSVKVTSLLRKSDMWNLSFSHTILSDYESACLKVTHVWPWPNLTLWISYQHWSTGRSKFNTRRRRHVFCLMWPPATEMLVH